MLFLVAAGFFSLLFSLVFTPLCRELLIHLDLVDAGDSVRRLHQRRTPRMGGIAVFAAYVGAIAVALILASRSPEPIPHWIGTVVRLLPATAVVFFTGVLDDMFELKPAQKLGGQIAAASLACLMGVRIVGTQAHPALSWWGIPLTIVWLLGCTNAFNLIDGMDGLATGAGLFASVSIFVLAMLHGNPGLGAATVPLAGALLGFLRYNFAPASIFLGDCGSLVIGFTLGCYVVVWGQDSPNLIGMAAPLMALALPLVDTALAIARRFVRNEPIFSGDRGHIHHRLLDRGQGPKAVALKLYMVCGAAAIFALFTGAFPGHGFLFLTLFCLVIGWGVHSLNYIEFSVLRRAVLQGIFRRVLQEEVRLHQFETALNRVSTVEGAWAVLQDSCAEFGIGVLEWRCGDRVFRYSRGNYPARFWRTVISIGIDSTMSIDSHEDSRNCSLSFRFVEILRNRLPAWSANNFIAEPVLAPRGATRRFKEPREAARSAG